MDRDEQAEKILGSRPEAWPEGAQKLRLPLDKLPAHVREAVAARVARAVENDANRASDADGKDAQGDADEKSDTGAKGETVVSINSRRKFMYAAAAILIASLSAYIAFPWAFTPGGPETNPNFVRGRGDFALKRDGADKKITAGMGLVQGDKLVLKKNTDLLLKRDDISFYLSGPAVLEVRPGGLKNMVLFLDRGSLVVSSETKNKDAAGKGRPGLILLTRRARYTLVGTLARLTTGPKGERIAVQKGLFQVKGVLAAGATEVAAGKALIVPADPGEKIPPPQSLSAEDRRALNRAQGHINSLRTGKPIMNSGLSFESEDEIFKYYGILHEVELKDGQSYRGFAARTNGELKVHTTLGVVSIPASNFAGMKTIKKASP